MNERIRQLAEQAGLRFTQLMSNPMVPIVDGKETDLEKFAELLEKEFEAKHFSAGYIAGRSDGTIETVKECAEQIIAKGTDWVDFAPSQTGVRPEYWDMAQQIKEHFGVEERKGWVCPKCGIDRTRDACPNGHFATMTGDCPMTATAQSGVEE